MLLNGASKYRPKADIAPFNNNIIIRDIRISARADIIIMPISIKDIRYGKKILVQKITHNPNERVIIIYIVLKLGMGISSRLNFGSSSA